MKVLFIGGTGIISSACAELSINRGIDLYCLNRGQSIRPIPEGAKIITADYYNRTEVRSVLHNENFDAVVDWIAYTPDQIDFDINLFKDKTGQYIFISSASAYETPPSKLPITEKTPLSNPFWEYSRNKIACENRLMEAFENQSYPGTIVRPSHTYDKTILPFRGGYTMIDRMRKDKKIVVHGDGTSLWTMTHASDFAKGFVGLLGNQPAIGEAFHITSDEVLSWNQLAYLIAKAANLEPDILHVPSDVIAKFDADLGDSLLGDKSHSMIFDNTKIKKFVPDFEATIPFEEGVKEAITWYDADHSRQTVDEKLSHLFDKIIKKFENF